jgi:hypothetical protein
VKQQRLVDQPENLTANAAFGRIVRCGSKFANQRHNAFVRTSCLGSKGVDGCVSITDNAVPPSFGIAEYALSQALGSALMRKRCTDGLGVDRVHQFAYQLFLAPQCAAGLDARCFAYSLAQSIVQGHSIKLFGAQLNQFFAQLLQCQVLAFSRAFAGL